MLVLAVSNDEFVIKRVGVVRFINEIRRDAMFEVKGYQVYQMDAANRPVIRVPDNTAVVFHTLDCYGGQITENSAMLDTLDWKRINPAAGPVYVEGAMPGDVLKIYVENIVVGKQGVMAAIPGNGVLGNLIQIPKVRIMPVEHGRIRFNDNISIPCDPMIGVIGVAPKEGAIPCGIPGSHGGNMDNAKIKKGSILYLPVFHKGALLSIGDVHASMGDGEIMVTGVEIPARVAVYVEILKDCCVETPMLEDASHLYTIASHEDLEQAVILATRAMNQVIQRQLGLSLEDAGMLMSAAGDLQFCQVVDPKQTVRFAMSKTILPSLF